MCKPFLFLEFTKERLLVCPLPPDSFYLTRSSLWHSIILNHFSIYATEIYSFIYSNKSASPSPHCGKPFSSCLSNIPLSLFVHSFYPQHSAVLPSVLDDGKGQDNVEIQVKKWKRSALIFLFTIVGICCSTILIDKPLPLIVLHTSSCRLARHSKCQVS